MLSLPYALLFLLATNPAALTLVQRFGERIERRIDLWDVSLIDGSAPDAEVDAVMRGIETLIRQPGSGPRQLRELRRASGPPRTAARNGAK